MDSRKQDKKPAKPESQSKETSAKQQRLARALRTNLKRRKAPPVTSSDRSG